MVWILIENLCLFLSSFGSSFSTFLDYALPLFVCPEWSLHYSKSLGGISVKFIVVAFLESVNLRNSADTGSRLSVISLHFWIYHCKCNSVTWIQNLIFTIWRRRKMSGKSSCLSVLACDPSCNHNLPLLLLDLTRWHSEALKRHKIHLNHELTRAEGGCGCWGSADRVAEAMRCDKGKPS